jgi:hypothetical protein
MRTSRRSGRDDPAPPDIICQAIPAQLSSAPSLRGRCIFLYARYDNGSHIMMQEIRVSLLNKSAGCHAVCDRGHDGERHYGFLCIVIYSHLQSLTKSSWATISHNYYSSQRLEDIFFSAFDSRRGLCYQARHLQETMVCCGDTKTVKSGRIQEKMQYHSRSQLPHFHQNNSMAILPIINHNIRESNQ